jgi:hypothetical protein
MAIREYEHVSRARRYFVPYRQGLNMRDVHLALLPRRRYGGVRDLLECCANELHSNLEPLRFTPALLGSFKHEELNEVVDPQ